MAGVSGADARAPVRNARDVFPRGVVQSIVAYLGDVGDLLRVSSACVLFCEEVYEVACWMRACGAETDGWRTVVGRARGGPAVARHLARRRAPHAGDDEDDDLDVCLRLKDHVLEGCPRPSLLVMLTEGRATVPPTAVVAGGTRFVASGSLEGGSFVLSLAMQQCGWHAGGRGGGGEGDPVRYSLLARCRLVFTEFLPRQEAAKAAAVAAAKAAKHADASAVEGPECVRDEVQTLLKAGKRRYYAGGSRTELRFSQAYPVGRIVIGGEELAALKSRLDAQPNGRLYAEVRLGPTQTGLAGRRRLRRRMHDDDGSESDSDNDDGMNDSGDGGSGSGAVGGGAAGVRIGDDLFDEGLSAAQLARLSGFGAEADPLAFPVEGAGESGDADGVDDAASDGASSDSSAFSAITEEVFQLDEGDGDGDDGDSDGDGAEASGHRMLRTHPSSLCHAFYKDPLCSAKNEVVHVYRGMDLGTDASRKHFPGRGKALASQQQQPQQQQQQQPSVAAPAAAPAQNAANISNPVYINVVVYTAAKARECRTPALLGTPSAVLPLLLTDPLSLALAVLAERGLVPSTGAQSVARVAARGGGMNSVVTDATPLPLDVPLIALFGPAAQAAVCLYPEEGCMDEEVDEQRRIVGALGSPAEDGDVDVHCKLFDTTTGLARHVASWRAGAGDSARDALSWAAQADAEVAAMAEEASGAGGAGGAGGGSRVGVLAVPRSDPDGPPKTVLDPGATPLRTLLGRGGTVFLQKVAAVPVAAALAARTGGLAAPRVSLLDAWDEGRSHTVRVVPSPAVSAAFPAAPSVTQTLRLHHAGGRALLDLSAVANDVLGGLCLRALPVMFFVQPFGSRVVVDVVVRGKEPATSTGRAHVGAVTQRYRPEVNPAAPFVKHGVELFRLAGGEESAAARGGITMFYDFDVAGATAEASTSDVSAARELFMEREERRLRAQHAQRQQEQAAAAAASAAASKQVLGIVPPQPLAEMSAEARRELYAARYGEPSSSRHTLHNEAVKAKAEAEQEEHRKRRAERQKAEVLAEMKAKKEHERSVRQPSAASSLVLGRQELQDKVDQGKEEARKARVERERCAMQRERVEREREKERVRLEVAAQKKATAERAQAQQQQQTPPAAPAAARNAPDSCTIQFQLPGGVRVQHVFPSDAALRQVKEWVLAHDSVRIVAAAEGGGGGEGVPALEDRVSLLVPFPRKVYGEGEMEETLSGLRFPARSQLVVHVSKDDTTAD
eukprot:Rhum_TRINITY_DN10479_c0_g1::Rhum_TRINITY_DN10479_c0_g1_i1::g.38280::m.38280